MSLTTEDLDQLYDAYDKEVDMLFQRAITKRPVRRRAAIREEEMPMVGRSVARSVPPPTDISVRGVAHTGGEVGLRADAVAAVTEAVQEVVREAVADLPASLKETQRLVKKVEKLGANAKAEVSELRKSMTLTLAEQQAHMQQMIDAQKREHEAAIAALKEHIAAVMVPAGPRYARQAVSRPLEVLPAPLCAPVTPRSPLAQRQVLSERPVLVSSRESASPTDRQAVMWFYRCPAERRGAALGRSVPATRRQLMVAPPGWKYHGCIYLSMSDADAVQQLAWYESSLRRQVPETVEKRRQRKDKQKSRPFLSRNVVGTKKMLKERGVDVTTELAGAYASRHWLSHVASWWRHIPAASDIISSEVTPSPALTLDVMDVDESATDDFLSASLVAAPPPLPVEAIPPASPESNSIMPAASGVLDDPMMADVADLDLDLVMEMLEDEPPTKPEDDFKLPSSPIISNVYKFAAKRKKKKRRSGDNPINRQKLARVKAIKKKAHRSDGKGNNKVQRRQRK